MVSDYVADEDPDYDENEDPYYDGGEETYEPEIKESLVQFSRKARSFIGAGL